MEVRHLRYFVAVVAEGSITRAAKRLHIAQPPLSRQIHQLEDELGVQLLDRSARPMSPTEAGRFFYGHALHVLDRIEAMLMLTKRVGKVPQGRFGIGFVGSTLYGPLPDIVRRFRAIYPALQIEMLELTSIQQAEALHRGEIDAGFGRLEVTDAAIKREILAQEPLFAAVPIGHRLLDNPGAIRLKDLIADDTLIVYPSDPRPSYADQVLAILKERSLAAKSLREVRELQTALGLVAAGIGIALVPAAVQRFRNDDIVYRALDDQTITSPIIMICRQHNNSPEISSLLRLTFEIYQKNSEASPWGGFQPVGQTSP